MSKEIKYNMFKFRLHFTRSGRDDYMDVEAKSIKEVQAIAQRELVEVRGMDAKLNNFWSEQLK